MGRKRNPVTVTKFAAKPLRKKAVMTDTDMEEYKSLGLSPSEAHRLHHVGINADLYYEYTKRLPGGFMAVSNVDLAIQYASCHVTPTHMDLYPEISSVETLAKYVRDAIPPEIIHEYSRVLGWRAVKANNVPQQIMYRPNLMIYPKWDYLVEFHRKSIPPSFVEKYKDLFEKIPSNIMLSFILAHVPPALIEKKIYRSATRTSAISEMNVLGEWKKWVVAADGHVNVAFEVCQNNGTIEKVGEWLRTGEDPERIGKLVSVGLEPEAVKDAEVAELTQEELSVWSVLANY